jgi:hypothetical protein
VDADREVAALEQHIDRGADVLRAIDTAYTWSSGYGSRSDLPASVLATARLRLGISLCC